MLESIKQIKDGMQNYLGFEPLRSVSFCSKKAAFHELQNIEGKKLQKELLVTFLKEECTNQEESLFQRLKSELESKESINAMLKEKWPSGIPEGKVLALEGNGDLYVDVISQKGQRICDVGVWALSQIMTIEQKKWGYSFTSLLGKEYNIKDSHIKLAISATPEEEGLMGVCLRMIRIAIADHRLLHDAQISSTLESGKIEFFNEGKSSDKNFDFNLRWISNRLDSLRSNGNSIRVLCMPEHNCIACFRPIINEVGETLLGSLELQPASSMRMYKLLPATVQKIIDEKWASYGRQLLFGQIRVTPFTGTSYITKLHGYYPFADEVMAVSGSRKIDDNYVFQFKDQVFEFSEAECKLAAMITPRGQGMIGICANIAHLCYLKNNYSSGYERLFESVMQMAESGYVVGINNFIKSSVEHVRKAKDCDGNKLIMNGIYSEIQAVRSEFIGIVRRNNTMKKDPKAEYKKMYMRIAEKMGGSEADIELYKVDRNGEEIPVKLIEVKNTLSTLVKKVYSRSGVKQFGAYFQECARHTNDCGDRCAFDVYITHTDTSLFNRSIFKVEFLKKMLNECPFEASRLKALLEKKRSDGRPYEKHKVREILYLVLNELSDLRSTLVNKDFPIRIWLWSNKDKRFIRFNSDLSQAVGCK